MNWFCGILIFLLSANIFATGGEGTSGGGASTITNRTIRSHMSWNVINKVKDIKVSFPYIQLKNTDQMTFVSYDSFCADGENLKVIKPGKKCTNWKTISKYLPAKCTNYEKVWHIAPREHKSTNCVEWKDRGDDTDCSKWETTVETHPLNKEVSVYSLKERKEDIIEKKLFSKDFELPDCYDAIKE